MTLYGKFDTMVDALLAAPLRKFESDDRLTCIDLFCGIGGFHIAAKNLGLDIIFASDIDEDACATYKHNFGLSPMGDIVAIPASEIPDHDILLAGFPCQPFSIIGSKRGTFDSRGTLYREIIRIARVKKPLGIVLENVKQLVTAQRGMILREIICDLENMGYTVDWRILNALDFGLPQKRERVIIVASLLKFDAFSWPKKKVPMISLTDILEENPDPKHFVSERIHVKRQAAHTPQVTPSIWHENKAGHISSYPWSCALRAGASYNYLLVNGERRLTPREMLRLQGFPDSFEIIANDSQARKQAGNAVPVPLAEAGIKGVLDVIRRAKIAGRSEAAKRALSSGAVSR